MSNKLLTENKAKIILEHIFGDFEDGRIPYKIEKLIKSKYSHKVLSKDLLEDGYTETLNYDVYESLISYIDEVIRNIHGKPN